MQTPFYPVEPSRVLLLSDRECSVKTDISTLHSLGITALLHKTSAEGALRVLESASAGDKSAALGNKAEYFAPLTPIQETLARCAGTWQAVESNKNSIDLVICDDRFEGRHICFFLHELAKEAKHAEIPVLIISRSPDSLMLARQAGLSAIARPYTQKDLFSALSDAVSPLREPLETVKIAKVCAALEKSITQISARTSAPLTTTDLLKRGMKYLAARQIDEAEKDLLAALKRQPDHIEACLCLAKIYREKSDATATNAYLLRAAAASQRRKETDKANAIKALLPENMQNGSILLHEAMNHMIKGDFSSAARGFLEHCDEDKSKPFYAILGRACQMTSAPQANLEKLCEAYARLGYNEIAVKIRSRLLCDYQEVEKHQSTWLDNFPLLRDFISIASYTANAWKQA